MGIFVAVVSHFEMLSEPFGRELPPRLRRDLRKQAGLHVRLSIARVSPIGTGNLARNCPIPAL